MHGLVLAYIYSYMIFIYKDAKSHSGIQMIVIRRVTGNLNAKGKSPPTHHQSH